MHEMVIVEGIIEAVLPEVKKYPVSKVKSIKLKIGELSGIVPECVKEYFKIAAVGTIMEGADIVIEHIPVTISCKTCGYKGEAVRHKYACPKCGSIDFTLTGGNEYLVDSVEAD